MSMYGHDENCDCAVCDDVRMKTEMHRLSVEQNHRKAEKWLSDWVATMGKAKQVGLSGLMPEDTLECFGVISELNTDIKTLASAVLTANYHKGIIYNMGGAAAAITIENAAAIARKYAE